MKRKKTILFLLCAVLALAVCLPALASAPISPALSNIAAKQKMSKTTSGEAAASFSAEDFDRLLGVEVERITVTALPPATDGRLLLGSEAVIKNQSISRDYLGMLCFMPADESVESSFGFRAATADAEYTLSCALYANDGENSAPTAAGMDELVFCLGCIGGSEAYGTMKAYDPESDELLFEVSALPEHGEIRIIDASRGTYCYTPDEDYTGSDSFCYTARDKYGAYSDEITVEIEVEPSSDYVFYSDMGGHWANYSAAKMTSLGVMEGESASGMSFFMPEREMTRSGFVCAAMKAAGFKLGDVVGAYTVFADHDTIPEDESAYIAEAARLGYITGTENGRGELCFEPDEPVTRAEAAVILCNILDADEPLCRQAFADETSIPAWAAEAVYTMNSLGIMNGTGEGNIAPMSHITRAQCAAMLCLAAEMARD